MAITYEPIATTTLGSATNTVTFNPISGSYTDLILIANATLDTGSTDMCLQFNSDTTTNYSSTHLSTNGSTGLSNQNSNNIAITMEYYGYMETTIGTYIANIMNYSNATTYKTVITRGNTTSNGVDAGIGLWRSTSAITSLKVFPYTHNFTAGSTFTLYGIKAA